MTRALLTFSPSGFAALSSAQGSKEARTSSHMRAGGWNPTRSEKLLTSARSARNADGGACRDLNSCTPVLVHLQCLIASSAS